MASLYGICKQQRTNKIGPIGLKSNAVRHSPWAIAVKLRVSPQPGQGIAKSVRLQHVSMRGSLSSVKGTGSTSRPSSANWSQAEPMSAAAAIANNHRCSILSSLASLGLVAVIDRASRGQQGLSRRFLSRRSDRCTCRGAVPKGSKT